MMMPLVLSIDIYRMLCEVMCVLSSMPLSYKHIDRRKLGVLVPLENIPAVYLEGNVAKRLLRLEHNLRNPGLASSGRGQSSHRSLPLTLDSVVQKRNPK